MSKNHSSTVQKSDPAFATTLAHGLSVLEAFQGGDALLSNRDLVERTGLSKATVSRLTYTLMLKGLVQYDAGLRRYRLGSRVLSLSYPLLADISLRQIARPYMRELANRVGGTVSLGLYDQHHMVYVETSRGHDLIAFRPDIGARLPVLASAMGRAWLASVSQLKRQQVLDQIAEFDPEQFQRYGAAMEQAINDFTQRGYCVSEGDWQVDVHAVGVPFPNQVGDDTMVFNCGVRVGRLGAGGLRDRVAPGLLAMVDQIQSRWHEG